MTEFNESSCTGICTIDGTEEQKNIPGSGFTMKRIGDIITLSRMVSFEEQVFSGNVEPDGMIRCGLNAVSTPMSIELARECVTQLNCLIEDASRISSESDAGGGGSAVL